MRGPTQVLTRNRSVGLSAPTRSLPLARRRFPMDHLTGAMIRYPHVLLGLSTLALGCAAPSRAPGGSATTPIASLVPPVPISPPQPVAEPVAARTHVCGGFEKLP